MIKIISVEIDGFIVSSQKVKLDFVESTVVCIYGENGSGKTTFLEILFAVFDRNEGILDKHNVDKVIIAYVLDYSIIKKQIEELEGELQSCQDEDRVDSIKEEIIYLETKINDVEKIFIGVDIDEDGQKFYNFKQLDLSDLNSVSSLCLGIGRGIHKKELEIPRNKLWHFFNSNRKVDDDKILTGGEIDSMSEKLAEYLMPTKKSSTNRETGDYEADTLLKKRNNYLPYIEIDTIEALLKNRYKKAVLDAKEKIDKSLVTLSMNFLDSSKKALGLSLEELRDKLLYNRSLILEMYGNGEDDGIANILEHVKDSINFLEILDDSKQMILYHIVNGLEHQVELFKQIQTFVDEYNKFLNYNKKLVFNSNGVYIAPNNHSLQQLSSGERHMLTFLATILLLGGDRDFILIDEPEISLDIEWQEKLLATIAKLVPNAQIIVASHSPSIMGNYFDESVEINVFDE